MTFCFVRWGNTLLCAAGCFLLYKCLFIYFWLFWVFLAAGGQSLVVLSGGYSSAVVSRLITVTASLLCSTDSRELGLQKLLHVGSVVVVHGLS